MTLGEVLAGVPGVDLPAALTGVSVAGLEYDSRRAGRGTIFFAFPGARVDGRGFAQEALNRGAIAVVSELAPPTAVSGPWIRVAHGRKALAIAARNFYGGPDERVFFTGITGTNGKTTTSILLESILNVAGQITGLIGTIAYRLAGATRPAPNTTPESLDILRFAAELERQGGQHLIMEVSSHALALGRVHGIRFRTAVFTNLTRDHLDFHNTMEQYAAAKRLLFAPEDSPAPRYAVLNADDHAAPDLQRDAHNTETLWYGLSPAAELRAENVEADFQGVRFDLLWKGEKQKIESPLLGRINILNMLAAAGAALTHGVGLSTIARGVAACHNVPGRFERVDCGQPFLVVVDYAHTDDALRNAIQMARHLTKGRVITVFGCGGDRDRTKRPLMGMAAAELSDYVVLTSDNPRSEDPLAIMNDALVGIRRFDTPHTAQPDRAAGIEIALKQAKVGDVVLISGKGHETYQVLRDRTIDFDDREVARELLRTLGHRGEDGPKE